MNDDALIDFIAKQLNRPRAAAVALFNAMSHSQKAAYAAKMPKPQLVKKADGQQKVIPKAVTAEQSPSERAKQSDGFTWERYAYMLHQSGRSIAAIKKALKTKYWNDYSEEEIRYAFDLCGNAEGIVDILTRARDGGK